MSSQRSAQQAPLHGITVLDLAQVVSGPLATRNLADLGANVIKIEKPRTGDIMRGLNGKDPAIFHVVNRNKRSVVLDLCQEQGRLILYRLLVSLPVDVVVHNIRDKGARKLGIDAASLLAVKKDLIVLEINGYGETGPMSQRRAYDPHVQAVSGLMAIQSSPDTTGRMVPHAVRTLIPDAVTSLTASEAIIAALFRRERWCICVRVSLYLFVTDSSMVYACMIVTTVVCTRA